MNHPTSARTHCFLMPGTSEVSCAARLHRTNSSWHCYGGNNTHLLLISNFPGIIKMNTPTKLFEPYKLGPITLPNRLVMAPLTRHRAVPPAMVPSPLRSEEHTSELQSL